MLTAQQKIMIQYTRQKVRAFFADVHVPGHGYDHAERVAKWAVIIAKVEKADVFLSEMAAILHDIGRGLEKSNPGKRHHELSYELCQRWFREDTMFDFFTKAEKLLLLYCLRYHWNDAADKYPEAIILRDADKLDALGAIGLKRTIMYYGANEQAIMNDVRLHYQIAYWLRTPKAWQIFKKLDLLRAFNDYILKRSKRAIKMITL